MKTSINDGGMAFPTLFPEEHYGTGYRGMTLRDYFAAQAMTGFIAASTGRDILAKLDARMCYQMADAMLTVREEARK
jgi:hypothetical protein